MPLRLFNTLTGKKEVFAPLNPPTVGVYVCGVTPYDMSHMGHARTYVTFDVVIRYLRALDYRVVYVKNFTDINDNIIARANAEAITTTAYSERYIEAFYVDMHALGVIDADFEPKVTTHIGEIVAFIEKLVARGFAYVIEGDVYYSVRLFGDYLKLSRRSFEELEAGARVEVDPRKRDPHDFALWKAQKPGEPSWPSPWGQGRPGWHIECSAMAEKYLGQTFDIHAGGRDLIFPHHENEIAQSEAASGKTFARYWMHGGMLNVDNEKMSKSLGNFFTIREVLAQVSGEALRAYFLNAQYRGPMNFELMFFCPRCRKQISRDEADALHHRACGASFSKEEARQRIRFVGIDDAERRLAYVYRTLAKADAFAQGAVPSEGPVFKPELVDKVWETFCEAMNDDCNTAAAIGSLSGMLSFMNELADKPQKPREQSLRTLQRAAAAVRRCGQVLGLYQGDAAARCDERKHKLVTERGLDVGHIDAVIAKRQKARAEKNFAEADALRVELAALGVAVKDTPSGAVWDVVDEG